jgi:hypothetical protein
MLTWVEAHGMECLVMYYVFSAFSGGMPTPGDNSSVWYRWAFSTLNLLNANIARLVATQLPASKMGQALTSGPPVQDVVLEPPKPADKP